MEIYVARTKPAQDRPPLHDPEDIDRLIRGGSYISLHRKHTLYTFRRELPRRARISRADVLDATLTLADERGLAAVSMRSVGERLGVTPMALYHHVRDKDDLLDGLVERLLAELPLPDPELPWQERLRALADGIRETAARHSEAFMMLLRRPVATPAALAVRGAAYEALRDAGVPEELVPRVERLVSTFVIGFSSSEVGGRFAAHGESVRDADFGWAWEHMLMASIDSAQASITDADR